MVTTADQNGVANGNGNALSNKEKLDAEEDLRTKARGFFADQFEVCLLFSPHEARQTYIRFRTPRHQNRSNFDAHFCGTGPEIWRQTNGDLTAFVAGAGMLTLCSTTPYVSTVANVLIGTGGTIAGTGQFLKSMNEDVSIALADPEGSGLYNKVTNPSSLTAEILLLHEGNNLTLIYFYSWHTANDLDSRDAGCWVWMSVFWVLCDFGTPLVQHTVCAIDICMPVSGYARGNVRQERERGHQAEASGRYRRRGHVSFNPRLLEAFAAIWRIHSYDPLTNSSIIKQWYQSSDKEH